MGALDRIFRRRQEQQRPLESYVRGLFAAGEQGVWYDISDILTMFQDSAGTTPVYMPGQGQIDPPVGRILDKSGRGNHASQSTATSRPTLSARYNGLLASEKFNDANWTWQSSYTSEITSEVTAPDGTNTAWKITSTAANAALNKAGATGYKNPVFTVWCKAGTRNPSISVRNATTATNLVVGSLGGADATGAYGKFSSVDLGGGWHRLKIEITSGVATTDTLIVYVGSTGAVPIGQYLYLWKTDLREAGDGVGVPEYQRVVDANTYDTQGFPAYLRFDGVDDWLQTAPVDCSGTDKATLWAAVRKLSDASVGMLIELSSTLGSNAGTFYVTAPGAANAATIKFATKGSVEVNVATGSSAWPSPVSAVVSGTMDIAAPVSQLSANGTVASKSTASLGTGMLGNYPLYIGRRGGASLPFNGRLYGLIIRGAATPSATLAKVERYLNAKARAY